MDSCPRALESDLERLIQKHSGHGVLVDTNLLILLLIGRLERRLIASFHHSRGYTPEEFDLLAWFVGRFRVILTAPHILTEVSNLAGKLRDKRLLGFRSLLAQEVQVLRERQCQARDAVNSEAFARFGLTDAVVHTLARSDVLVLTDDFPLAGFLEHHSIDVVNFNRLRLLVWS